RRHDRPRRGGRAPGPARPGRTVGRRTAAIGAVARNRPDRAGRLRGARMPKGEKNSPGVGLSLRERQIATLIAEGRTHAEVGEKIGKAAATVSRIAIRPGVRAEVDRIRGAAIEAGLGVLCSTFRLAVAELARIVQSGTAADAVRLGACRVTIESVLKT